MTSSAEIVFPLSKTLVEPVTIFNSNSSSPAKNTFDTLAKSTASIDKAEVVRSLFLGLKAGVNMVIITGLSSSINKRSVRISVKSGPATRLLDLVCTTDSSLDSCPPDSPEEVLLTLHEKQNVLKRMNAVHEQEYNILLDYGRSLKSEHQVRSEQVAHFLKTFSDKAKRSIEEETRVDAEILSLDKQIKEQQRRIEAKVSEAQGEVQLILVAENDGQANVKLTYVVSNASWQSVYELHTKNEANKPSPSVVFSYNAQVIQSTGEDWVRTIIKFGTSSNDLSLPRTIPQFRGMKLPLNKDTNFHPGSIRIQPSFPIRVSVQHRSGGVATVSSTQTVQSSSTQQIPGSQVEKAVESDWCQSGIFFGSQGSTTSQEQFIQSSTFHLPHLSMTVTKGSASSIYAVKGLTSVPSDGLPHQVPVAKLSLDAKISHVSVPWAEPNVYLRCTMKNTSDYKLLSDPFNILFDDTLVSISSFQEVNIGDEFECTLGTDPDIYVTYLRQHSLPRVIGGNFSDTSTDVLVKLSIQNKNMHKIEELCILGGVPVPDDKSCKVLLQMPEGLAEADTDEKVAVKKDVSVRWKDGIKGKAKGLFEWLVSVNMGQTLDLEARWVVRAPEHQTWTEVNA